MGSRQLPGLIFLWYIPTVGSLGGGLLGVWLQHHYLPNCIPFEAKVSFGMALCCHQLDKNILSELDIAEKKQVLCISNQKIDCCKSI